MMAVVRSNPILLRGSREFKTVRLGGQVRGRDCQIFGGGAADVFTDNVVAGAQRILSATGVFVGSQTDTGVDDDSLAWTPTGDVSSDIDDFTGDIGPAPLRHAELQARPAPTHPDIKMIQSAGLDPHDHIIGTRRRVGNITLLDDIQVSVFLEIECFHFNDACRGLRMRQKVFKHSFLTVEINIHRKGAKSTEFISLYVFR